MALKDILEFVQSSEIIIDTDSNDENKMNNAARSHIILNEARHEKHRTRGALLFLSRRESISGERPTSFPKKIQPSLTWDSNPLGYKPRLIATILAGRQVLITLCELLLFYETATAGSDVVQSGRPIFDDFFQHLGPYIGNNTANVVFQMVKRLWLIRIDQ
ncbi:hypothetical protein TNCV_2852781 [Trichonephila clavipes]|uniref:Uncharacterized protein n=1 Tax=Trichonephila clavipes TaxID=2585209 RepID=A0A8X6UV57_TRICX|nr:hypothetical protein TNCV_2852781 [Trichonephila clavipes]